MAEEAESAGDVGLLSEADERKRGVRGVLGNGLPELADVAETDCEADEPVVAASSTAAESDCEQARSRGDGVKHDALNVSCSLLSSAVASTTRTLRFLSLPRLAAARLSACMHLMSVSS